LSAVRRVRDAAAGYCEERGQFGLSGAAGQSAYVLAARVLGELGADIVADDRANSFHELHRRAIFGGVDGFLAALSPERRESEGSVLVQLMARTLVGDEPPDVAGLPRSVYTFASQPSRTHHALCQGSSESSLLEALAYAQGGWRDVARGVRCELHDDGYTAVLGDADVDLLRRPAATDGSRIAEGKDKCIGPRAADIVLRGLSREASGYLMVAGVPVGDTLAGLAQWRAGYTRRLARLRELAVHDLGLATLAASALGGPAGLANHLLRAIPPTAPLLDFWRQVDDEWVGLWVDMLDADAAVESAVSDRVMLCRGGCGMRCRGAAEHAEQR